MTLVERSSDPQLATGFAALRLGEPVQRALDEIGYSEPTPVQAAAYPLAIAGRDITPQEWQRALPGRPYQHICPH